jgi:hypothetical protein
MSEGWYGPRTSKALLEGQGEKLGPLLPLMHKGELLVTVNRKVATLDSIVRDGDTVKVTVGENDTLDIYGVLSSAEVVA